MAECEQPGNLEAAAYGFREPLASEDRPMVAVSDQTTCLAELVAQLARGDTAAREELLTLAGDSLRRLTRRMFRTEHRLQRWEQTDDVCQNASLRLYLALADVRPTSVREFFRLAALHIRRELIDMARHYYGPRGMGTRQTTCQPARGTAPSPLAYEQGDTSDEPSRLATWREFHERVARLPDQEREMFD